MGFVDLEQMNSAEPMPGCHMKAPCGQKLMFSYLEMDDGAEVPWHSHPHEQGGIVIEGQLELTIGDETRMLGPRDMYLIPSDERHRAVAVGGPAVVVDVFTPIREEYAALSRSSQNNRETGNSASD